MRFQFMVGLMPVRLHIDTQFIVNMVIPADGSSRISGGFSYDSSVGFVYQGIDLETEANLDFLDMDSDTHETGATSPISANFGIGFPRLEMHMFGVPVVPWCQTAFLIGGSYTVTPPCQTADILFLGAAGIDLKFLGSLINEPAITFFQVEEPLLRAGQCPN